MREDRPSDGQPEGASPYIVAFFALFKCKNRNINKGPLVNALLYVTGLNASSQGFENGPTMADTPTHKHS